MNTPLLSTGMWLFVLVVSITVSLLAGLKLSDLEWWRRCQECKRRRAGK
jgi:hypothetical protein